MRLGKREQIVIYGIAGLAAALCVHLFVFSKKTAQFSQANSEMVVAESTLGGLKKPQSPLQLTRYQQETDELASSFQTMIADLKLPLPEAWTNTTEQAGQIQMDDLMALLAELRERRERGQQEGHTTLTFLGEGQYFWNFPTQLPGAVQRGEQNLYDLLTRLLGNLKTVRASIGSGQEFREEQFAQYAQTLALLDINYYLDFPTFWGFTQRPVPALFEIYQQAGPPVPFLKLAEHARLFLENQPDDVRPELKTQAALMELLGLNNETGERSYAKVPDVLDPTSNERVAAAAANGPPARGSSDKININLPWHSFLFYRIQLAALIQVIDIADAAGIASIDFVRLRSEQEIMRVSQLRSYKVTPTPKEAIIVTSEDDYNWFDDGGGGAESWDSFGATPTPADEGKTGIFGTPIDMVVRGSNQAISQFLYDLSTVRLPIELDSMKITSVLDNETGQATLTATISLNVLAVADKVTH